MQQEEGDRRTDLSMRSNSGMSASSTTQTNVAYACISCIQSVLITYCDCIMRNNNNNDLMAGPNLVRYVHVCYARSAYQFASAALSSLRSVIDCCRWRLLVARFC